MYLIDVYEFNVVVDMETGGKVPSNQLEGLVIDGKKYKHYDEVQIMGGGYTTKKEALACVEQYENNKNYRVKMRKWDR